MGFSDENKILIKNLHDSAWIHCGISLMTLPIGLQLVDIVPICYIHNDLFHCCIFNYEIMPATVANTFLLIS